jgi:hypothetical protein
MTARQAGDPQRHSVANRHVAGWTTRASAGSVVARIQAGRRVRQAAEFCAMGRHVYQYGASAGAQRVRTALACPVLKGVGVAT